MRHGIFQILSLVILDNILAGNAILEKSNNEVSDLVVEESQTGGDNGTTVENIIKVSAHPGWRAIDIYEGPHYFGTRFRGTLGTTCANMPKRLRKHVGSIDTMGSCVVVFPKLNCQGGKLVLERHSWASLDVANTLGYATGIWNGPLSLRLCSEEDTETITFYTEVSFSGTRSEVSLELTGGCVDLPSEVDDAALSISLSREGVCIVVYSGYQCTGHPRRYHHGNPSLDDLSSTGMDNTISSACLCSAADDGGLVYLSMMTEATANLPKASGGQKHTPEMKWEVRKEGSDDMSLNKGPSSAASNKRTVKSKRALRQAKSEF